MIRAIVILAGMAAILAAPGRPADKLTARRLIRNLEIKTFSGQPVELRYNGSSLAAILSKFEEISGLEFKISPSVEVIEWPLKQYNFLGIAWDKALDSILSDNGLKLRLEGGALWVEKYTPSGDKGVSAFLVGALTAAALSGGTVVILTRRKKRRRNLERVRKITMDPAAVEEAIQRLNYLFRVEKIHRNGQMSLDSLSERLALQSYQLSGIINSRLGRTFTDLVADYRIEEVKQRLADPGETANILNIAYDAGFGTKASFNRIFKERAGQTPSEFKKRNTEGK